MPNGTEATHTSYVGRSSERAEADAAEEASEQGAERMAAEMAAAREKAAARHTATHAAKHHLEASQAIPRRAAGFYGPTRPIAARRQVAAARAVAAREKATGSAAANAQSAAVEAPSDNTPWTWLQGTPLYGWRPSWVPPPEV